MLKGKISEVFNSIQGEGIYLGEHQVFVRFFGCNLSCKYCDTKLNHFREYEPQEIFEEIRQRHNGSHSIAFTGGEPLVQKDFIKEVTRLTSGSGFVNYLETNGTLPDALDEVIDHLDIIAMDFKLATSGGTDSQWDSHRDFLKIASRKEVFLKAVICESTHEEDLNEAISLIRAINRSAILVLQPNSYEYDSQLREKLENFKRVCEHSRVTACIIPQMHKIVGIK